MLVIKMNLSNKEIKQTFINNKNINILFESEKGYCPIHLQFTKKQIKQLYNRIVNHERKEKKFKAIWKGKR